MDRARERGAPGKLARERTTIAKERLTSNSAIAKEVRVFMAGRLMDMVFVEEKFGCYRVLREKYLRYGEKFFIYSMGG